MNQFAFPVEEFLAWVAGVARAKGAYVTRGQAQQDEVGLTLATADITVQHILAMEGGQEAAFQPNDDDRFFADMALEQARSSEPTTEYGQSLKRYAEKDTLDLTDRKATGILASAVGTLKRQQDQERFNAELKSKGLKLNEYFGEPRKRVTFIDAVVLTDTERRNGNYGTYTTAKVATAEGHWLVGYNTPENWKANTKVSFKATIRKHFEDKGGNKWTALGNVKALSQEEANQEVVRAHKKAEKAAKAAQPKTPEQIERQLKAKATRERKKATAEALREEARKVREDIDAMLNELPLGNEVRAALTCTHGAKTSALHMQKSELPGWMCRSTPNTSRTTGRRTAALMWGRWSSTRSLPI
jgi:hypothetical protein